jgi:hypothetical protein
MRACQSAAAGVMFEGYVCVLKRREERGLKFICANLAACLSHHARCMRAPLTTRAPSPQGAWMEKGKKLLIFIYFSALFSARGQHQLRSRQ